MPKFSVFSKDNLADVDPRLQRIFELVIQNIDCRVICGHRNEEVQNQAFKDGFSEVQWPNSSHNSLPSKAVDVVPYPVDWEDKERFHELAGHVKMAAFVLGIPIKWGGDFKSFFDGPHYELVD